MEASGWLEQERVVKDAVDAQVVLGPAYDGGFYLIGATRTAPAMLQVCLLYCMHPFLCDPATSCQLLPCVRCTDKP